MYNECSLVELRGGVDSLMTAGTNASVQEDRGTFTQEQDAASGEVRASQQIEEAIAGGVQSGALTSHASSELVRNFTASCSGNELGHEAWKIRVEPNLQKIDDPTTYYLHNQKEVCASSKCSL